jgi:hypothetical protein
LENQNIKHEKFLILMAVFALSSCAELQQIANHPTLGTIGGLDVGLDYEGVKQRNHQASY